MYTNFESLRKEARDYIVESLRDYEGWTSDFHNMTFKTEYYECYTSEAIKKLEELNVFEAVQKIKEYEQNNFGTVNTDFSNPCNVLNMLWYIVGEEELYDMFEDCQEWDEWWSEDITDEARLSILNWLKENEKI